MVALWRECESGLSLDALYQSKTTLVFGRGPLDSALMVIGEAPGKQEDLSGKPLVGPAGQLFDQALQEAGAMLPSDACYRANILKCRAYEDVGAWCKDRKPTTAEIGAHGPWLLRQIELLKPRIILTLGAAAWRYLRVNGDIERMTEDDGGPAGDAAKNPETFMGKVSGKLFHDRRVGATHRCTLMPVYHPGWVAAQFDRQSGEPRDGSSQCKKAIWFRNVAKAYEYARWNDQNGAVPFEDYDADALVNGEEDRQGPSRLAWTDYRYEENDLSHEDFYRQQRERQPVDATIPLLQFQHTNHQERDGEMLVVGRTLDDRQILVRARGFENYLLVEMQGRPSGWTCGWGTSPEDARQNVRTWMNWIERFARKYRPRLADLPAGRPLFTRFTLVSSSLHQSMYGYRGSERQIFLKLWTSRPSDILDVFALLDSELYQRRLRHYLPEALRAPHLVFEANVPIEMRFSVDAQMRSARFYEAMDYVVVPDYRRISYCDLEIELHYDRLRVMREQPRRYAPQHIVYFDIECGGKRGRFPVANWTPELLKQYGITRRAGARRRSKDDGSDGSDEDDAAAKAPPPKRKPPSKQARAAERAAEQPRIQLEQARADVKRLTAAVAAARRDGTAEEEPAAMQDLCYRLRKAQRYAVKPGSKEDTDPMITISFKMRRLGENEGTDQFALERVFCYLAPDVPRPDAQPNLSVHDSECDMMRAAFDWLHHVAKPDKYKTWNGSNFDFRYIWDRIALHHGQPELLNWGMLKQGRSRFYTKMYSTAAAGDNTIGVTTMDLCYHDDLYIAWRLNFKSNFYAMNYVAGQELTQKKRNPFTNELVMEQARDARRAPIFLEDGVSPKMVPVLEPMSKIEIDHTQLDDYALRGGRDINVLVRYNDWDNNLQALLNEKRKIDVVQSEMAALTNTRPVDVWDRGQQYRAMGLLLMNAHRRDQRKLIPTFGTNRCVSHLPGATEFCPPWMTADDDHDQGAAATPLDDQMFEALRRLGEECGEDDVSRRGRDPKDRNPFDTMFSNLSISGRDSIKKSNQEDADDAAPEPMVDQHQPGIDDTTDDVMSNCTTTTTATKPDGFAALMSGASAKGAFDKKRRAPGPSKPAAITPSKPAAAAPLPKKQAARKSKAAYKGAFVFKPVVGVHDVPITTLDFMSLYPNLIRTYRLCFSNFILRAAMPRFGVLPEQCLRVELGGVDSIQCGEIEESLVKRDAASGKPKKVKVAYFVQSEEVPGAKRRRAGDTISAEEAAVTKVVPRYGLLHTLLTELLDARKATKNQQKPLCDGDVPRPECFTEWQILEQKQIAEKVVANSIYGATAARKGLFALPEIGASVTSKGRENIKRACQLVQCRFSDFEQRVTAEERTQGVRVVETIGGEGTPTRGAVVVYGGTLLSHQ